MPMRRTPAAWALLTAPVVTPAVHERITREVMEPTVRGLSQHAHLRRLCMPAVMHPMAPQGHRIQLPLWRSEHNRDDTTQLLISRTFACLRMDGKLDQVTAEWIPASCLRRRDGRVAIRQCSQGDVGQWTGARNTTTGPKYFHAGTQLHGNDVVKWRAPCCAQ